MKIKQQIQSRKMSADFDKNIGFKLKHISTVAKHKHQNYVSYKHSISTAN